MIIDRNFVHKTLHHSKAHTAAFPVVNGSIKWFHGLIDIRDAYPMVRDFDFQQVFVQNTIQRNQIVVTLPLTVSVHYTVSDGFADRGFEVANLVNRWVDTAAKGRHHRARKRLVFAFGRNRNWHCVDNFIFHYIAPFIFGIILYKPVMLKMRSACTDGLEI